MNCALPFNRWLRTRRCNVGRNSRFVRSDPVHPRGRASPPTRTAAGFPRIRPTAYARRPRWGHRGRPKAMEKINGLWRETAPDTPVGWLTVSVPVSPQVVNCRLEIVSYRGSVFCHRDRFKRFMPTREAHHIAVHSLVCHRCSSLPPDTLTLAPPSKFSQCPTTCRGSRPARFKVNGSRDRSGEFGRGRDVLGGQPGERSVFWRAGARTVYSRCGSMPLPARSTIPS